MNTETERELPSNTSRILLKISCPALGDTLCATPTVRKVALSYGHKVDIMCHRVDLFERSPYVDKLLKHTEEDPQGYSEIYETYNHWLMTNKNMNVNETRDSKVQIKLSNFEARQFHALGVGITLYPEEMEYDYFPAKQTEDSLKIDKNCIVIHPTENWPNRTWPLKHWQRLVDLIKTHTDMKVVMIGKAHREQASNEEGHIVKGLIDLKGVDYNYGDDTPGGQEDASILRPISELYHVLNNSFGLVSFDAGPIHLAGCTDTNIFQIGASIRWEKTAPYRKGTQTHKFHFVGGDCKVFCGSDPKYSVKSHGTINSLPYYPSCLEGYSEFKCQPGPDEVFNKIMEVYNVESKDSTNLAFFELYPISKDDNLIRYNFNENTGEAVYIIARDVYTGLKRHSITVDMNATDGHYWWAPGPGDRPGLGPVDLEIYVSGEYRGTKRVNFEGGKYFEIRGKRIYNRDIDDYNYSTFWEVFINNEYDSFEEFKIKEGDIVLDKGANHGFFSLHALDKGASKIYAIEPVKETFNILTKLTEKFPEITRIEKAVTDKTGTVHMDITDNCSATNHLQKYDSIFTSGGNTTQVRSIEINELLDSIQPVNYIKIDCEGSEYEIFKNIDGSKIDKVGRIVCEVHGEEIDKFVYNRLLELGFTVKRKENILYAFKKID